MLIRRAAHNDPLYRSDPIRALERRLTQSLPPHTLMRRAGLALARLGRAIAPQARQVWVACGPGNNGGDGLEAAIHLKQLGLNVHLSLLGDPTHLPPDAANAWAHTQAAGLCLSSQPIEMEPHDLIIDALLGIGCNRAPDAGLAEAITALNASPARILAADVPSGLNSDTGEHWGGLAVRAHHTLTFLGLKPGLFTAHGRDHAGQVWHASLHDDAPGDAKAPITHADTPPPRAPAKSTFQTSPCARLGGPEFGLRYHRANRHRHATHKCSFGDVWVIGGDEGMAGAAWLAASAALASGAGRVWLSLLDESSPCWNPERPELMTRPQAWKDADGLARSTVVAGCGGGRRIHAALEPMVAHAKNLVLDADALNSLGRETKHPHALANAIRQRGPDRTVMTPHPLEAARMLATTVQAIQADRLQAAQTLAEAWNCTVVLKGSGTVIAAPRGAGQSAAQCVINMTGNSALATPGTGDVLAGWIGGLWAQQTDDGHCAADVAQAAVSLHGLAAEQSDVSPLRASDLIESLVTLARIGT